MERSLRDILDRIPCEMIFSHGESDPFCKFVPAVQIRSLRAEKGTNDSYVRV